MSFFDPVWTSDGQRYAESRYKEIVQERYLISKHTNTSYNDTADITPVERSYILQFIIDDLTKQKEILDSVKSQQNNNKGR